MTAPALAIQIVLALVAVTAGACDLRVRRIPNWLSLPALGLGLALNGLDTGAAGIQRAVLGLGLALLVYLPLYLLRGMGAGDVKLMAAIGALAGYRSWLIIFVFTALLGGVVALVLLWTKGGLGLALRNVAYILGQLARFRAPHRNREALDVRHPRAVTLPHGLMIAAGTLAFLALRLAGYPF